MTIHRVGDLEIDQDLAFERRSRLVESIGAWLMAGTVLAAALGLFGSGPLSAGTARADGLVLDFQRLTRYQSSETLSLRLDGRATGSSEVRVWLDRGYLEAIELDQVMPTPIRAESASDRVIFVVAMAEPGQPLTITFSLQPQKVGFVRGRAGLEGGAPSGAVTFRQLVLP